MSALFFHSNLVAQEDKRLYYFYNNTLIQLFLLETSWKTLYLRR